MKTIFKYLIVVLIPLLWACEDVITLDLQDGVEQLVVDAWISNDASDQVVKLTLSQNYFDNSPPKPALGAQVILFEDDSTAHPLIDVKNNGEYILPAANTGFLTIGKQYALYIKYNNEEYASLSKLNRVPAIDSLTFQKFTFPVTPPDGGPREGMIAEFFAKDPQGEGDTYWIRAYKNDTLLSLGTQINIAYDAGFSPGSKSDALMFIRPIRQSINDGLYQQGDKVKVELLSINPEAYYFLLQVRQESGNGGLFSTPPANSPTNVFNLNTASDKKVLGFFNISAISRSTAVADINTAKPEE